MTPIFFPIEKVVPKMVTTSHDDDLHEIPLN